MKRTIQSEIGKLIDLGYAFNFQARYDFDAKCTFYSLTTPEGTDVELSSNEILEITS